MQYKQSHNIGQMTLSVYNIDRQNNFISAQLLDGFPQLIYKWVK